MLFKPNVQSLAVFPWVFPGPVVAPGMAEDGERPAAALREALELLAALRQAAVAYATDVGGWSEQLGLYVHVFGHNSVASHVSFLGFWLLKVFFKQTDLGSSQCVWSFSGSCQWSFSDLQVNSLHLHLVDMKAVGPTMKKLDYKNCPLNAVLEVLQEELLATEKVAFSGVELSDSQLLELMLGSGKQ